MFDLHLPSPSGTPTRIRKVSPVQTRRGAAQFERDVLETHLARARSQELTHPEPSTTSPHPPSPSTSRSTSVTSSLEVASPRPSPRPNACSAAGSSRSPAPVRSTPSARPTSPPSVWRCPQPVAPRRPPTTRSWSSARSSVTGTRRTTAPLRPSGWAWSVSPRAGLRTTATPRSMPLVPPPSRSAPTPSCWSCWGSTRACGCPRPARCRGRAQCSRVAPRSPSREGRPGAPAQGLALAGDPATGERPTLPSRSPGCP